MRQIWDEVEAVGGLSSGKEHKCEAPGFAFVPARHKQAGVLLRACLKQNLRSQDLQTIHQEKCQV